MGPDHLSTTPASKTFLARDRNEDTLKGKDKGKLTANLTPVKRGAIRKTMRLSGANWRERGLWLA